MNFIKGSFINLTSVFKYVQSSKRKVIHMDADIFGNSLRLTLITPFQIGNIIFFDEFSVPFMSSKPLKNGVVLLHKLQGIGCC